ncbi:hypothetical protein EDE08_101668 [Bradyrhizobium sp. R2.2-H]|nr:hypothetical protein EDE10_101669 [Bradyrhizobium sp. Y-H1]TCU80968.1 hypothetical protein EDE08_101668 [Bradyrhizobium sp. R2.2-H]
MTTCEYDGTASTYNCQREEQCDDCFMVDHQKECGWCEFYDHTTRKLEVKHLPSDYPKAGFVERTDGMSLSEKTVLALEEIAEHETRWGEPLTANQE